MRQSTDRLVVKHIPLHKTIRVRFPVVMMRDLGGVCVRVFTRA